MPYRCNSAMIHKGLKMNSQLSVVRCPVWRVRHALVFTVAAKRIQKKYPIAKADYQYFRTAFFS